MNKLNYINYLSNYTQIQSEYILHHKREYGVNQIIGIFDLKRYNVPRSYGQG